MKISKLFHTLYAFLMFLPVMVLPLFAININQKEVEPLTAQIEETQLVDFNQLQENGNFNSESHWGGSPNTTLTIIENVGASSVVDTSSSGNKYIAYYSFDVIKEHIYYARFTCDTDNPYVILQFVRNNPFGVVGSNSVVTSSGTNVYTLELSSSDTTNVNLFYVYDGASSTYLNLSYCSLFDISQMFGMGNEPSIEQFNDWYSNDYYQYTLSDKQLLRTGIDTLNNTDIGSQFLYSLYNPLKDYFNLSNYMNLGGLYDWFLINLFSGYNTPVYFIIFTLMLYWLALSLLWLIFDVLMYVPSMIHKMLDKARME